MKFKAARFTSLTVMALALGSVQGAAAEAPYPCETLTFVVPYPPGGNADVVARLLVPGMSANLAKKIIIDNRGGASGSIGTEYVARAAADGCTALVATNTNIVINRNLYTLKTDPAKMAPVGQISALPLLLYTNAAVPAQSVSELVDLIRKSPGKFSFASPGGGSPHHLAGEMLKLQQKLDLEHIPYRGSGPAMNDVIAGQVPFAFETAGALGPFISSGKIKVLATTGSTRARGLPSVPTMKEAGFDAFVLAPNWYGIFLPESTPPAVVNRLNQALNATLKSSDVSMRLAEMGSDDVAGPPEKFRSFIGRELPYWRELVQKSGAKVE